MALARYIASLFARWPKSKDPKSLGREAERLAAWYLRLKGFRILARNWRTRYGEIDLVAEKGKLLVFVEVKARRRLSKGLPEEALSPTKQKRLLKLAEIYLSKHPHPEHEIRLDLLAIDFSSSRPKIRHYEGVIYA